MFNFEITPNNNSNTAFCKHSAKKLIQCQSSSFSAIALDWLVNNRVGKNQPNLLFWWSETCWSVLVVWIIHVHHFRAGTCSVILLIVYYENINSNHTTFLVQLGNNLHSYGFQKAQIAFALWAHAILILFAKTHWCKLFPNWTWTCMITYTNCTPLSSVTIINPTFKVRSWINCWKSLFFT